MNHLLRVGRYIFKPDWTISHLYINNISTYYGVEDELRVVKVKGETAVDYGVYKLGTRHSPQFSKEYYYSEIKNKLIHKSEYILLKDKEDYKEHELIWIKDTPRHEYVLIHWGNTDDDTAGCYIIGDRIIHINGQDGVGNSRNTYKAFYQKVFTLIKYGSQTIEYFNENINV